MAGRRGINEIALEDRAQPLRAIYQHWERHQWSPYEVDFATDAASFAALDEERREALLWILAQGRRLFRLPARQRVQRDRDTSCDAACENSCHDEPSAGSGASTRQAVDQPIVERRIRT